MAEILSKEEVLARAQAYLKEAREQEEKQFEDLFPLNQLDGVIGQVYLLTRIYKNKWAWCPEYGWLVYEKVGNNGGYWKIKADSEVSIEYHDFCTKQLRKAEDASTSTDEYVKGLSASLLRFSKRMQSASAINGVLEQATVHFYVPFENFDSDPNKLNTADGVYDLPTRACNPSKPTDYMTKFTPYHADGAGVEEWANFLYEVTCGDDDLQTYLQTICGLSAYGKVLEERLFIAYGKGGNGKSTFWNAVKASFGTYAISAPSEILVTSPNGNSSKSFEMARFKGARMALFAELGEERRLDTGLVKQVTSTDNIVGSYKFKDSFDFKPSHTPVLFCNCLPEVHSRDDGTWDRLTLIPFNAHFRYTADEKKNYGDELIAKCGDAILTWILDGACMVAEANFKLSNPSCVQSMIDNYRHENDWLTGFIEANCELVDDPTATVSASALYDAYVTYCKETGAPLVKQRTFGTAMAQETGFERKRTAKGFIYSGIRLINSL